MSSTASGEGSAARRRLGEALRNAREQVGISGAELGRRARISQSKVSRSELGQQVPTAEQIKAWAAETGADADALEALRVEAAGEAQAWRQQLRRGLPRLQAETGAIERAARTILAWHPTLIPGLVQTESYARAVYRAFWLEDRPDVDQAIAARLARQAVLYQPGKRIEFLVGEPALRWRMGSPGVMAEQLDRLRTVVAGGLSFGIVPLDVDLDVWHSHHFTVYADRADDDDPLAHVELLPGGYNLTDSQDVDRFVVAFERLRERAAYAAAALDLIDRAKEIL